MIFVDFPLHIDIELFAVYTSLFSVVDDTDESASEFNKDAWLGMPVENI